MNHLSTPQYMSQPRDEEGMVRIASVEQGIASLPGQGFTSSLVSTYNLTSTILGAGILAIPLAFSKCGVVVGFIFMMIIAKLSSLSCNLILSSYLRTGKGSYGDLAHQIFGYSSSVVVKWVIILLNIGAASGYMVVVKQLLPPSLCHLFGDMVFFCTSQGVVKSDRVSDGIVGVVVYAVVFPLMCLENLSSLRHTSMIAFLFAVFLTGAIIYRSVESRPYCHIKYVPDAFIDVFEALPIFCFSFVCHLNVLPVYEQLRKRSPSKMRSVFRNAINFSAILYSLCGIFGYLKFSCTTVPSNILSFEGGFDVNDNLIVVARIAEALVCTLALPLIQHPTRIALHSWYFHEEDDEVESETVDSYALLHPIDEEGTSQATTDEWRAERSKILIRILESFLILTVSYGLALLIPNISSLFGLLGSSLCAVIVFLLPGMFYLRCTRQLILFNGENERARSAMARVYRQRVVSYLLAGVGLIIGCVGTVATAMSIQRGS